MVAPRRFAFSSRSRALRRAPSSSGRKPHVEPGLQGRCRSLASCIGSGRLTGCRDLSSSISRLSSAFLFRRGPTRPASTATEMTVTGLPEPARRKHPTALARLRVERSRAFCRSRSTRAARSRRATASLACPRSCSTSSSARWSTAHPTEPSPNRPPSSRSAARVAWDETWE